MRDSSRRHWPRAILGGLALSHSRSHVCLSTVLLLFEKQRVPPFK
ncbi:hypothetical protein Y047_5996 [Burkholderia pseudomallei MSHR3016]|nr:hypothetical protein Y047_5996 [Burkholderia pseudomallei MSHR3016]